MEKKSSSGEVSFPKQIKMNYIQNQMEIQGICISPTFLMPSYKLVSHSLMPMISDSSILFISEHHFFHLSSLKLKHFSELRCCFFFPHMGLVYGGWEAMGGVCREKRGGVGCRVSETTKPAFSTMPPCPVVSQASSYYLTVANQIKSLQDNSLIPCQTKVCKQTTKAGKMLVPAPVGWWEKRIDRSVHPGTSKTSSTCKRPERFLVALVIRFNKGLGQLARKTQLRFSDHRLHPRKHK